MRSLQNCITRVLIVTYYMSKEGAIACVCACVETKTHVDVDHASAYTRRLASSSLRFVCQNATPAHIPYIVSRDSLKCAALKMCAISLREIHETGPHCEYVHMCSRSWRRVSSCFIDLKTPARLRRRGEHRGQTCDICESRWSSPVCPLTIGAFVAMKSRSAELSIFAARQIISHILFTSAAQIANST